jgi:phage terminase small subunit
MEIPMEENTVTALQVVDPQPDLSPKETAFVDAYVGACYGNATQAVLAAGYDQTYDSARVTGSRLLAKANVRHAIAGRINELAMTREETLARLTAIARGDVSGALRKLAQSDNAQESLKDLDPSLIKRVRKQTGKIESIDVEISSPLEALIVLARWHGLLQPDVTVYIAEARLFVGIDVDRV